jgi:uncharacterized protein
MTKECAAKYKFRWADLGNIEEGRPNMGPATSVAVYRLMQYTLKDVLTQRYGGDAADELMVEAGKMAGTEFCKNLLNTELDFGPFIAELQARLKDLTIGVLKIEKADLEKMEFTLTVSEDLDCSGLPVTGEVVCAYDEGFIAGILDTYTGLSFDVKEIDCWATGDRTCRFTAKLRPET